MRTPCLAEPKQNCSAKTVEDLSLREINRHTRFRRVAETPNDYTVEKCKANNTAQTNATKLRPQQQLRTHTHTHRHTRHKDTETIRET